MAENMQSMQHQMMGYDRAITMFSPDGRLLQVEYAKKTVRQGSTAIGLVCKDGVLLVADRRIIDKLVLADEIEKIWKIDEHMAVTGSGIISDARVLVERAQLRAQQHRVTYDSPIDAVSIVKDISDIKQLCTQSGGLRPFGVSLLIAAVDVGGKKLYETDPTGIYFPYRATAIGEGETEIKNILSKEYNENLTMEQGLKLSLDALRKLLGNNFNAERIEAARIPEKGQRFEKITKDEISKAIKKR